MAALATAFRNPVASSQGVFRAVMDAMARPGTIRPIAFDLESPSSLSNGAAAVALTLLDYETPVWLDPVLAAGGDVSEWLRFHTGAPLVDDSIRAAFAFISSAAVLPPFSRFFSGSMEYPDRSTTLVVQVDAFEGEQPLRLAGPGIAGERDFSFAPMPEYFADALDANRALFPRGIDLLFVTDEAVTALPRSTRLVRGA